MYANLDEIRAAAHRSADLTRQLLAFARKQTIAPKPLVLNEAVSGMLKMLERLIGEDIRLLWRPSEASWWVKMDPSQVDQVLANLCVNARDAILGGGTVVIETTNVTLDEEYCGLHRPFVPGEYVVVAVSDDGCGMDRETVARVFEPFFTTKALGKGTGLGLATVYGAVKQNQGYVNVYSEPDIGTTVRVYLPRHYSEEEEAAGAVLTRLDHTGRETVLVVEDEASVLRVACAMLKAKGYTIFAAATPAEALRLASEHADTITLLLTDVVMPDMNGQELATRLRAEIPSLRCIFMSGYPAEVMTRNGLLGDGVHMIPKPFSAHDLLSKVRQVLDAP